ncbi:MULTISPECIES: hypothetical protein, partial [Rhodococcus]
KQSAPEHLRHFRWEPATDPPLLPGIRHLDREPTSVRQLSRTTPSGCDTYLGHRTDNVDKDISERKNTLTTGFAGIAA